ncbi:LysR family transcriptional regulator [Massilia endophytica]|uniref:LysR family transcriptional regulator n=1 Tax=Massilia endophytica TaxID=2899220 RepID=UPI001E2C1D25|nr:LysR family transcriptional regulator [Massilia endophytica]UGQ49110.1 LysR family transcriptional regulator [Massilia endophytica]
MHKSNWEDLRYFLAVAESGSLSAAARLLGLTHSTVMRRMDALEERLEVRLFERFQTGYVMTAAGLKLRDQLLPLAAQMSALERQLGGQDAGLSGQVRLTTTDTLLHGVLAPILAAFRARYPGIALQVSVNNHFLNLTRREADIAVRPSNKPPEDLVATPVGTLRTAPYASAAWLADRRAASLEELDWVAADEGLSHLAQARWVESHIAPERIVCRMDSLHAMTQAVAAGMGAGMLLCLLGDARPELLRLAEPLAALDTRVWVLTHPDLRKVQRVKVLADFLKEELRGKLGGIAEKRGQ